MKLTQVSGGTLILRSSLHNYNTRNSTKYQIPKNIRKKSDNNIHYTAVKLWNELPVSVISQTNFKRFK